MGCRGAVSLAQEQGTEPRATSKGILTQPLRVSAHPSEPDTCLAQWGANPSLRKPRETQLPQGREGIFTPCSQSCTPLENPGLDTLLAMPGG